MRKLRVLTLAAATFLSSFAFAGEKYGVETSKTKVTWLGEKVTGEHKGHINVKEGNLEFDGDVLKSVHIVMDMNSITCTDIEDKEYNAKLVGHLKSDDFFGVEAHATSTFHSTSVKVIDAKKGTYEVTGNMVIKGTSHEETFTVEVKKEGDHVDGQAKIVIDRSNYNVKYGSTSFFDSLGDKAIYDNFTLMVELHAKK